MQILAIFVAILAMASAQCPTCDNALAALATSIQVCGNDLLHTYNANDFNLVSLGFSSGINSYAGNVRSLSSGDVEGRVLAAGDLLLLLQGYSIGDKIVNWPGNAPWAQKAYSAVVGGNVAWTNGQLNPFQDDATHRVENGVYFGANSNAPAWLRFSQCTNATLDLAAFRQALQDLSTQWSVLPANAYYEVENEGQTLVLHGPGSAQCSHLLRVNASDWNAHHAFMLMGDWNVGANIVIDIVCDEQPFLFMEGEFPGLATNIVYNFGPSCENVEIQARSVTGSILAPWSILNQADGRILGNVYVGEVLNFLQINVIPCPPNPNVCDCCDMCVTTAAPKSGKCSNLGRKH